MVQQRKVKVHACLHNFFIIAAIVIQYRKKVLKKARESEMLADIDHRYMTEESDGENDTINQHKPTWQSQG